MLIQPAIGILERIHSSGKMGEEGIKESFADMADTLLQKTNKMKLAMYECRDGVSRMLQWMEKMRANREVWDVLEDIIHQGEQMRLEGSSEASSGEARMSP